ncbi:hypothetical protein AWB76_06555 [Caballeronia temeraria]|uniref:Uncharacterized protein n=1 Tax=Caballeronia temeraria TaxID=1777137 RepID=A0A158D7C9_9BURK|nr:hypothetical protein AWB76_06555 [Caballeronia temeraria]
MTRKLRLDLAKLDAEPANLDLMIVAPEELEAAIGKIASEVSRAIKTRAGHERIVDETLGSKLGTIQISARHTRATDI